MIPGFSLGALLLGDASVNLRVYDILLYVLTVTSCCFVFLVFLSQNRHEERKQTNNGLDDRSMPACLFFFFWCVCVCKVFCCCSFVCLFSLQTIDDFLFGVFSLQTIDDFLSFFYLNLKKKIFRIFCIAMMHSYKFEYKC